MAAIRVFIFYFRGADVLTHFTKCQFGQCVPTSLMVIVFFINIGKYWQDGKKTVDR